MTVPVSSHVGQVPRLVSVSPLKVYRALDLQNSVLTTRRLKESEVPTVC